VRRPTRPDEGWRDVKVIRRCFVGQFSNLSAGFSPPLRHCGRSREAGWQPAGRLKTCPTKTGESTFTSRTLRRDASARTLARLSGRSTPEWRTIAAARLGFAPGCCCNAPASYSFPVRMRVRSAVVWLFCPSVILSPLSRIGPFTPSGSRLLPVGHLVEGVESVVSRARVLEG